MTLHLTAPPKPRKPRPTLHPVIETLRLARYKQGITALMLAEMTGYSAKAIYQWEAGVANPKLKQLADWSEALGMQLELRAAKHVAALNGHSDDWERFVEEAADYVSFVHADALDRKDAALRVALEALTHMTNCYIGLCWTSGGYGEGSGAVKQAKNAIAKILEVLNEAAAQEDSNGS